jgi:hypothetical protein
LKIAKRIGRKIRNASYLETYKVRKESDVLLAVMTVKSAIVWDITPWNTRRYIPEN